MSSAVVGLIAGGKDFALVTNMCAKYGLDPRNAGWAAWTVQESRLLQ